MKFLPHLVVVSYVRRKVKHAPCLTLGKDSGDAGSECQKAGPVPHGEQAVLWGGEKEAAGVALIRENGCPLVNGGSS